MEKRILAADIGGTNARFAYFSVKGNGQLTLVERQWLRSQEVSSLTELFAQLRESDFTLRPSAADIVVIAIAGPVENGNYSKPPHIDWIVDLRNAESEFGIKRYLLINDFVAQAFACRSMIGEEAEEVVQGTVDPKGTAAVVGAGTNLGKAILVPIVPRDLRQRTMFMAVPSEGGHSTFPVQSGREAKFAAFVCAKTGEPYLTCENVVSGKGISAIHEFLTGRELPAHEVAAEWLDLDESSEESETLLWASRFYGRVCRNFALDTLATGGLYIAGGVAAKSPILVRHRSFRDEFQSSPKHAALLQRIPVFLIRDEESGLWGAAFAGLQELPS